MIAERALSDTSTLTEIVQVTTFLRAVVFITAVQEVKTETWNMHDQYDVSINALAQIMVEIKLL